MEVPQRTKNRVVIQFCDLTLGNISEKKKNTSNLKRYKHSSVNSSTVYNCQDMEAIQTSIDREVGKEDVVYLHNGILLSHKKNEIMPFAATRVDLEIII